MVQLLQKRLVVPNRPPIDAPRLVFGNLTDADVVEALKRKPENRLPAGNHPLLGRDVEPSSRFGRRADRSRRFAFPQPSFMDVLGVNTVAGSSFGTFTTAKTVIPTNSLCTLPPGYWTIGRYLEVEVWGGIGTLVATPGTIVFQIMPGFDVSRAARQVEKRFSGCLVGLLDRVLVMRALT